MDSWIAAKSGMIEGCFGQGECMAAPRRVVELVIGEEDLSRLMSIARSRTEAASRVERARMLLASG
jgi:citrate lyase beta subunit